MDKLSIQSCDCHKSPHSRTKFTLPVWLVFSTLTGKTTDGSVVKFFFPTANTVLLGAMSMARERKISL